MKFLLINSSDSLEIQPILEKYLNFFQADVFHYKEIPGNFDTYHGIIISPTLSYTPDQHNNIVRLSLHDAWSMKLGYFLPFQKYRGPMLGVCFGHQLLGRLYHTEYIYGLQAEHMKVRIKLVADDPIFSGLGKHELMVDADHTNAIALPDDFQLLASSATCEVQVMKHIQYPWYGFQFHAEEYPILLENFRSLAHKYHHSSR